MGLHPRLKVKPGELNEGPYRLQTAELQYQPPASLVWNLVHHLIAVGPVLPKLIINSASLSPVP